MEKKFIAPAQDKTKQQIQALEAKLTSLFLVRDSGMGEETIHDQIKETRLDLEKQRKFLKRKMDNAENQKKFRKKCKMKNDGASARASTSGDKSTPGRPRLEEQQDGLLETIRDIAIFGSAAHDRRQTEEIRSCRTLNDLQAKLSERGYNISRSGLYLRLLPKRSASVEGRRHVVTVPVKLSKPQNSEHKHHPDGRFCISTIRNVDSLASLLGPKQVMYLSQDDKARVQIGVIAANKQSPILMHTEYRVILPDHNFVMANKHKLIPSVVAGIGIHPDGLGSPESVSYSGPTYIAIRSGKHSSSTAATHSTDLSRILELEIFNDITRNGDEIKPVVIFSVDGGPDENPRCVRNFT